MMQVSKGFLIGRFAKSSAALLVEKILSSSDEQRSRFSFGMKNAPNYYFSIKKANSKSSQKILFKSVLCVFIIFTLWAVVERRKQHNTSFFLR